MKQNMRQVNEQIHKLPAGFSFHSQLDPSDFQTTSWAEKLEHQSMERQQKFTYKLPVEKEDNALQHYRVALHFNSLLETCFLGRRETRGIFGIFDKQSTNPQQPSPAIRHIS